jgi:hypothetical protein
MYAGAKGLSAYGCSLFRNILTNDDIPERAVLKQVGFNESKSGIKSN